MRLKLKTLALALVGGWLAFSSIQAQPAQAGDPSVPPVPAIEQNNAIVLVIDGKMVPSDVLPLIMEGRTLVPLRVVAENLGLKAKWIAEKQEARLEGQDKLIRITLDQKEAELNGKPVLLDVPATLVQQRLLVPLRFVAEALGAQVAWDERARKVTVVSPVKPPLTPILPELDQVSGIDWTIENNEIIVLLKSKRADYRVSMLSDPERLLIDLTKSKLGEDIPKTTVINLGPIKQIRLGQFQEDVARVVFDLTEKSSPQISRVPEGIRIRLTSKTPLKPPPGTPLVLIDPGHGGSDPGALGASGSREKDVTLRIALLLRDLLRRQNIAVHMTRSEDMAVSLSDRGMINDRLKPDIFLSIHANSFVRSEVGGTESFYFYEAGKYLTEALQKQLLIAVGREDRGVKQANFHVLRTSNVPASLVEIAFISNPEEERLLVNADFQNRVSQSLMKGIMDYLKRPLKT